ncbi:MAG: hypothetical protein WC616_02425 [Candidatus Omnitrophota bacterium]
MWFEPKERTLHSGIGATSNGQIFDLDGKYGALRLQITGITSATITFEQSNDNGTTWDGIAGTNTETGAKATTATADGTFLIPITGVKKFRARISTYVTGTIYAYAMAVPAIVAPMEVYASLAAGTALAGKVGIDQATANANEVVVKSITAGDTNIGNVDIASALPAGAALIGKVGIDQTTPGTTNRVDIGAALPAGSALVGKVSIDQATANANEVVVKSITAGANVIGKFGIDQTTPGTTNGVQIVGRTGAYTTPTHTAVTVGVATGAALALNANRLYALLVNDSDTAIYIKLGVAAALNQGIRINANGGSYEISKELGNLYTGAINAISSLANKTLLVTEGV